VEKSFDLRPEKIIMKRDDGKIARRTAERRTARIDGWSVVLDVKKEATFAQGAFSFSFFACRNLKNFWKML